MSILKKISVATVAIAFFGLGVLETAKVDALSIGYINSAGYNVDYLNSYGNTVTYLNNPTGLQLASLSGFDAVMVTTNGQFNEPTNIGNVVADFADLGRGVVLTQFDFYSGVDLSGRIMTNGYSPFTVSNTSPYLTSTLGTVYQPTNTIFTGVNVNNVTTTFQSDVSLTPGATRVADWTSGRAAIGYNTLANSSVVGLNLFPASNFTNADTQRLVANALSYSTTAATPVPFEFSSAQNLALGLPLFLGLRGIKRRRAAKNKRVAFQ